MRNDAAVWERHDYSLWRQTSGECGPELFLAKYIYPRLSAEKEKALQNELYIDNSYSMHAKIT